jgi:hypothetical protein
MKRTSLILAVVFALTMLPAAFGQSTPSPAQDPNMQPSGTPSQQAPNPTNPGAADGAGVAPSDAQRSFVGSIMKTRGKYVLHTGDADYQLDNQAQAKKFDGKDVKVTGQLDESSKTIKVQSIDSSSSM